MHCVELSEQHKEAQFALLSPLHIIPGGMHPLGTKLGPELGSFVFEGDALGTNDGIFDLDGLSDGSKDGIVDPLGTKLGL